jgi:DNA sulfur modification protein DndB
MEHEALILAALRGHFGDWTYYACLMPLSEVAARVDYAHEVHPDKALSALIQRRLEGARARQIAKYLVDTEQRFFNSLVLATYGGTPEWFEVGNFKATTRVEILSQISDVAQESLGFLRLSREARIFAVDGQHRLAGIKRAISDSTELEGEQIAVLFVAHKTTKAGLQRTRRLFTTLNKMAVPVQKSDIIALDEDDAMAIIARRLVETNPNFKDPKIAVISSLNIPVSNRVCLTNISSLYDILRQLFMFDIGQRTDRGLRFNRPSDERLDHFHDVATSYFSALSSVFTPISRFFSAGNPGAVTEKYRGPHGGDLLFRSLGLEIFTKTAIEYSRARDLQLTESVKRLGAIPTDLAERPYRGVIWDSERHKVIVTGKQLAQRLLRHMVGLPGDSVALAEDYNRALGRDLSGPAARLPGRVV